MLEPGVLFRCSSAANPVVTSSSAGVWWIDHHTSGHLEAIPVAIVDRVGAGDALTAGTLNEVLDGELVDGIERGFLPSGCRPDYQGRSDPDTEDGVGFNA